MHGIERTAARELGRSFQPARCIVLVIAISSRQRSVIQNVMHWTDPLIQELINQCGSC